MPDDPEVVVTCPFCGNDYDLERRGHEWWCPCCSRAWLAYTAADAAFLKVNKILVEPK